MWTTLFRVLLSHNTGNWNSNGSQERFVFKTKIEACVYAEPVGGGEAGNTREEDCRHVLEQLA